MHLEHEINMHDAAALMGTPLEKQFKAIRFSLRLAKAVCGEPSDEMVQAAVSTYLRENYGIEYAPSAVFKSMTQQLIKEISE
jgi:hypothetical protein